MKIRLLTSIGFVMALLLTIAGITFAADSSEVEPNNTPAQANPLTSGQSLSGSIAPAGDVDYFSLGGINTGWGFIALLDTSASSTGDDGVLTALGSDGVTELQTDSGSWERGSGIALQNFADGSDTHYLRVNESGEDETISSYGLRYYKTITDTQPEVEPNGSRSNATPSSFTMSGTLISAEDVDCFSFQGSVGDDLILALDGDPEDDGGLVDYVLELVNPSDAVLKSADVSGSGGKEFIEYNDLPSDGVYAYCVKIASGSAGTTATYHAGLVVNGGLYFPDYSFDGIWLNPRANDTAFIGDQLSYRLEVTNTSPLKIPGNIRITASYDGGCSSLVAADPPETFASTGYVSWNGQKTDLAPGETYGVNLTLQAEALCNDQLFFDLGFDYFFTGTGEWIDYDIVDSVFVPIMVRNAP